MTFAQPWLLLLLIAVPVALVWWWRGARAGRRLVSLISRERASGPRYAVAGLFALSAAAAIVAAAQPRWGTRESFIPREGAQLIIVLDVSRSMAVDDVKPVRLEAAKAAITTTLKRLGGDRVGLVIFAGDARLRFPLTTDFAAATQVIQSLETGGILVEGGTSAALGLDVALSAFDDTVDAGRMILLITDGDDLGADPAAVATRVKDSGVDLLVAGAGHPEGGTVKVLDTKTRKLVDKLDAGGAPIVSRLNEGFLRALAAAAGGRYIGADLGALPGAVDGRIATLKRARFERQSASLPVERYSWFAAASLGFLVLATVVERMPRAGGRPAALGGLAAAMLLVVGCATRGYDLNEEGRAAFAGEDFKRAAELFVEAQAEQPDNPGISLNLAAALAADGRYEEASLAARRALNSPAAGTRARAHASIGHHRFALEDYAGALDAFRQALLEDPRDQASRHDYEVVLRILTPPEAPEEQQPPPPPPGQDGETPTPGAGGPEPPSPGAGTPAVGPTGTPAPGQGTPAPGQGTPAPGGTPASGEPPLTPERIDQALTALDAQIAALIDEAGEEPTATEALRILELLAERARLAAQRDALAGGGDPNDY
ncbi:MAG: VWA domain-containing protein [Dehalococcoidia bacterium]